MVIIVVDEKLEKYIRSVGLPVGTDLGDLKIKGILGVGTNGIVYEAYDAATQRIIAVKEYFPVRLAKRNRDLTVEAVTEKSKHAFDAGLKNFLDNGIQLSRVRHPNIVQLLKVEEKNNTVYLLMEKVDGPLMSQRLGSGHFIAPDIINNWVEKILDAINYIHDNGILHLAIDPSNIILNDRLGPVLIDFGQLPGSNDSAQNLRDNPYRAIELISSTKDQIGKHTDIYAAGAMFAHLITGTAPVPASSRSTAKNDPQTHITTDAKLKKIYSLNLLRSVDTALAVRPESRFASVEEWKKSISKDAISHAKNKKYITMAILGALAILVIGWITYGRFYVAEQQLWSSLSPDEPCTAIEYLNEYQEGRYAEEANTRVALCEERRNAELEKQRQQKQERLNAIVGEMVKINPGCYLMGSQIDEIGRNETERQHEVCIDNPYELAKFEVTVEQFRKFVDETGYKTDAEKNIENNGCWSLDPEDEDPWEFKSWASWQNPYKNLEIIDSYPVSCVSANDIEQFLVWLNGIADTNFRLPTEAEWEFAVRGKTEAISRPWGNRQEEACIYANVADTTNIPELTHQNSKPSPWPSYHNCSDGFLYAAPVGTFKPNHHGIHDLIGNVWELTCSGYSGSYGKFETACSTDQKQARADRGGGWESEPASARSATRGSVPYFARASNIGFRLARDGN